MAKKKGKERNGKQFGCVKDTGKRGLYETKITHSLLASKTDRLTSIDQDRLSTMHDCFELIEFSDGITSEKIEYSHFSKHGQLYIVTSNGALYVYLIDLNEEKGKAILLLSKRNFLLAVHARSIVRMEVMHELGMIVLLTEASSLVQFYDLESLESASVLEESLGASYFSCYSVPVKAVVQGAEGPMEIRKLKILICVLCHYKKKLLLYDWEDSIFVGCQEYALAIDGKVSRVFWKSDQELILGTMDFGYYTLKLPQGGERLVLKQWTQCRLHQGKPLILSLARHPIAKGEKMASEDENFLVMQDDESSLFLNWDSENLPFNMESQQVLWKETPSYLGFHFPFILVLSASGIEIRAVYSPNAMMQSMDLASAIALDSILGHYIVLCRRGKMYSLKPIPFLEQLQSLIAVKDYEEAIQLLHALPESMIENKHEFMKSIEKNHAIELFTEEKLYETALALLVKIAMPLSDMLELYPTLKDDYSIGPDDQADIELVSAYSALLPILLAERQRPKADFSFLDPCILKVYLLTMDGGKGSFTTPQAITNTSNAQLMQFLKSPHLQISMQVVESLLTRFYKYEELLDFYFFFKCHEQALAFISIQRDQHLAFFSDQTLCDYLSRLSSDYLELIFQYSKELPDHLLLSLFIRSSSDGKELKPRESIQNLLVAYDRTTVLKAYLEYIIMEKRDTSIKSHTMLAEVYLDSMREDPKEHTSSFLSFLKTSKYLDAEHIYDLLMAMDGQSELLLEGKAILLGRLDRHQDAISLLIHDTEVVERYCAGYYKEGVEGIFVQLLENYLKGSPPELEMQTRIISLLNKYPFGVDPLKALELLKEASYVDHLKMSDLATYFSYQLSKRLQGVREAELVRDLYHVKLDLSKVKKATRLPHHDDHGDHGDKR